MSSNEDLAAILEADTLTYIRVVGIFLVFSVALFAFTDKGKTFCLISLLISLILSITITIYYFRERSRISKFGFYTKLPIDILMYIMIGVIVFNIWIIYEVWYTESVSLAKIAVDIEEEVKQANIQDIAKQIEKQVELSNIQNKMLLQALTGQKIDIKQLDIKSDIKPQSLIQPPSVKLEGIEKLRDIERIRDRVNYAALAYVA